METETSIDQQSLLAAIALGAGLAGKAGITSNRSGKPGAPDKYSVNANPGSYDQLSKGLDSLIAKSYPDANVSDIKEISHASPGDPHHPGALLTKSMSDGSKQYKVVTDMNQDKAILAHELGHFLNANSPVMKQVVAARHFLGNNPMLRDAMNKGINIGPIATGPLKGITPGQVFKGSRYLLPAAVAGVMPGDDDVAASVAVNLALSSPTLVDEFMATKRGFDLMKEAGQDIPLKSRARMAGAFTSYLANPLLAAFAGNYVGNLVDSNEV